MAISHQLMAQTELQVQYHLLHQETKLPWLVIFKGPESCHVAKKQCTRITMVQFLCQENAWMNHNIILQWVDSVLKLYISNAPPGDWPILYSHCCHMLHIVINWVLKFNTFLLDVCDTVNLSMLDLIHHSKVIFIIFVIMD